MGIILRPAHVRRDQAETPSAGKVDILEDACCEDRDGEGPADDGLAIVKVSGRRATLAVLYEDLDRSGALTAGDLIRLVSRMSDHGPEPSSGRARSSRHSNGACAIDGLNREVIPWPGATAPAGEYRVYVRYHADCGVARSPFSVMVEARGSEVQSFTGEFEGASAASEPSAVTTIALP